MTEDYKRLEISILENMKLPLWLVKIYLLIAILTV